MKIQNYEYKNFQAEKFHLQVLNLVLKNQLWTQISGASSCFAPQPIYSPKDLYSLPGYAAPNDDVERIVFN